MVGANSYGTQANRTGIITTIHSIHQWIFMDIEFELSNCSIFELLNFFIFLGDKLSCQGRKQNHLYLPVGKLKAEIGLMQHFISGLERKN
ncbi:hypothetical protein SAMN03080617_01624 [Algoriphagus alkaliphilus]|uniref:Uncharacterized protein n=1 Tax=Algoriphagus alkaliphilus TaxID=279824 RepID=A0A1G5XA32_9BACT|nr:hypothetical protein [Cyclobacterium sp.]SDA67060.1 hypothetical protein SAMN03080617_01624 [Algoriphagus alkaliphilus]